jgi:hypothetical protein
MDGKLGVKETCSITALEEPHSLCQIKLLDEDLRIHDSMRILTRKATSFELTRDLMNQGEEKVGKQMTR